MTLSEELAWRGFIKQTTLQDITKLDTTKWTFYHGFDASADSQTIGNLAAMMLDKTLLRHGHKAIIVAGGATSQIGDPGGKDTERPLQTPETIARNVESAKKQIQKIFGGHDFILVNNLDWTKDLTVLEFLRDIGKHFSMTPLTQRDYIAQRMGEDGAGISYTEFSYSLLQAMDYLHLFDAYDCRLQIGGSDQWANCLSGVELIRKARGQEVHVITQPLVINKTTGKKFGKSEEGAIWLDPKKTSPTQFYQFWMNADDAGTEGYLRIFTELDKPTVDGIMSEHVKAPASRLAQRALADAVTELVHSKEETTKARAITDILTGSVSVGDADTDIVEAMRSEVAHARVASGSAVIDALVSCGLAASKSDARRLVEGSAVYVNGQSSMKENFEQSDFQNGRLLLRRGKTLKDTALIELI